MAEPLGNLLDVAPLLEQQGRARMSEGMEADPDHALAVALDRKPGGFGRRLQDAPGQVRAVQLRSGIAVLVTALALGDQLCGALRDPFDQLLGDVEGQGRHGRLSICVAAIAMTVQAAAVLLRLPADSLIKSTISLTLTFLLFSPTLGRMAQLMQVRQAARALGVHENTVRRWEERGLLRAVRLPSGVRRFRAEDVEAMRAQMFSGFAPLREDDDVVAVTRARSID